MKAQGLNFFIILVSFTLAIGCEDDSSKDEPASDMPQGEDDGSVDNDADSKAADNNSSGDNDAANDGDEGSIDAAGDDAEKGDNSPADDRVDDDGDDDDYDDDDDDDDEADDEDEDNADVAYDNDDDDDGGDSNAARESESPESPPIEDREQFENVGSNPFVMTGHDPFSTFAADVDSASYDVFRRDVNRNSLPDPSSVRVEEFVNYFNYEYPAPTMEDPHPFSINLAAANGFLERESVFLRVGIQAENAPANQKKPANLVFLIDVSGSMTSSDKLPLVKRVLTQTLTILDPTDTVSIVTYASDTGVRLAPTPVSESDTIEAEINALESGGSTAGASGINLAYEQAEAAFIDGGINHVVLCTDGDFNVGQSADGELVTLIEERRTTGITLTVLGFGTGNLNDSMMEKVSNAGNGIYGVISSETHADRYVADRMLSTMYHIAKDMKIQVEFSPEKVLAYRLIGYENRAIADDDFRDDTVDAGEVGAGHRVTALYELILAGGTVPAIEGAPAATDGDPVEGAREISTEDMVLVKVRYKEVDATETDPAQEVATTLTQDAIGAAMGEMDGDFQWAAAVAAFAEILKESPYAEMSALSTIDSIVTAELWSDADHEEFAQLFIMAKDLLGAVE